MTRLSSYLDPKRPHGIEPYATDSTVARVGATCLDVNCGTFNFFMGRRSFAWLVIAGTFLLSCLTPLVGYYSGELVEALVITGVLLILGFLSLLMPIHAWRTRVPLRFSRQTKKVYHYEKGKLYVADWDAVRAYLNVESAATFGGGITVIPQVVLEFLDEKGGVKEIAMVGADRLGSPELLSGELWEYIRVYMEHGPEHVPPLEKVARALTLKESVEKSNPFPFFRSKGFFGKLDDVLVFPFKVVGFFIIVPTDYIYHQLVTRIPRKNYPRELIEACACEEGEGEPSAEGADKVAA